LGASGRCWREHAACGLYDGDAVSTGRVALQFIVECKADVVVGDSLLCLRLDTHLDLDFVGVVSLTDDPRAAMCGLTGSANWYKVLDLIPWANLVMWL
jgi:hypothetical protein